MLGVIYQKKEDYAKALNLYNKCYNVRMQLKGEKNETAQVLQNIGIALYHLGNKEEAINICNESLRIRLLCNNGNENSATSKLRQIINYFEKNGEQ